VSNQFSFLVKFLNIIIMLQIKFVFSNFCVTDKKNFASDLKIQINLIFLHNRFNQTCCKTSDFLMNYEIRMIKLLHIYFFLKIYLYFLIFFFNTLPYIFSFQFFNDSCIQATFSTNTYIKFSK